MLYFVAAHDQNLGMGNHGHLPWPRMAADIERLHALTRNKTIVMGQRTYEEYKRVKHAFNIYESYVVSNSLLSLPDAKVIHDIKDIVALSKQKDVWVIGGGSIFSQLIAYVDVMYLTQLESSFDVDTYFPDYEPTDWNQEKQSFPADQLNPFPYTFLKLRRKQPLNP